MKLDHCLKVMFTTFLHCRVTVFPFPYTIFGGKSQNPACSPKGRSKLYPAERGVPTYILWNSSIEKAVSRDSLCFSLIIYSYQYGLIYSYCILFFITQYSILYFVAQNISTLTIGHSFKLTAVSL